MEKTYDTVPLQKLKEALEDKEIDKIRVDINAIKTCIKLVKAIYLLSPKSDDKRNFNTQQDLLNIS